MLAPPWFGFHVDVVVVEVAQVGSRVELFEQIRRDRRMEEMSIRELAVRHGVHRRKDINGGVSPQPHRGTSSALKSSGSGLSLIAWSWRAGSWSQTSGAVVAAARGRLATP